MKPEFSTAPPRPSTRRLAGWELIEPLLNSFEHASPGAPACMTLPAPVKVTVPEGLALMPHQAQVVGAASEGHRTFLLADEPGLGKTAQALLAAQSADAYPLLCVVPNVVKTNWAREVQQWTPRRTVTVVHGDGEAIDGFADIVVLNYEVLDRHVGWMGTTASAAWSSTRRTSSRTRSPSAPSTSARSPTGSGNACPGRCSWR